MRPANEYDADAAFPIMERQRESVGLRPKELLCDGAYGSADVRAKLRELGVEVVAKLRPLTDSKHFRKDEFEMDLRANDGEGSVSVPPGSRPQTSAWPATDGTVPSSSSAFRGKHATDASSRSVAWADPMAGPRTRCASLPAGRYRCTTTRKCSKKRVRTKDGRAEEGAPGEAAAPGEGGAQDI